MTDDDATEPNPGRRVGPIVRFLAGVMGFVGLATLAAAGLLVVVGAPRNFLSAGNLIGIVCCFLMAVYGISIAVRGRAPSGVVPWK